MTMDIDGFWNLIELSAQGASAGPPDGNMARYVANLEALLRARSPEEVLEFRDHFEDRMRESYNYISGARLM